VHDCCKNFSYFFDFQNIKPISKRKITHQNRLDSYVNPIIKAKEFQQLLKSEGLTQSQLAKKLGISKARITQLLNLLKLPQKDQEEILKSGKEKLISEKSLRNRIPRAG